MCNSYHDCYHDQTLAWRSKPGQCAVKRHITEPSHASQRAETSERFHYLSPSSTPNIHVDLMVSRFIPLSFPLCPVYSRNFPQFSRSFPVCLQTPGNGKANGNGKAAAGLKTYGIQSQPSARLRWLAAMRDWMEERARSVWRLGSTGRRPRTESIANSNSRHGRPWGAWALPK